MGPTAHALLLAQSDTESSGFPFGLVLLPAMFILLYVVMIRPQQRRAKAAQAMQRAVEVGDEILTTSGIYGIITAMDDEDLWLEVAEGVEVRVARGAVLKVTQSTADDGADAVGEA